MKTNVCLPLQSAHLISFCCCASATPQQLFKALAQIASEFCEEGSQHPYKRACVFVRGTSVSQSPTTDHDVLAGIGFDCTEASCRAVGPCSVFEILSSHKRGSGCSFWNRCRVTPTIVQNYFFVGVFRDVLCFSEGDRALCVCVVFVRVRFRFD